MTPPALRERRQLGHLLRSVVKVVAVSDPPDYDQPWQTHGPQSCFGSGAIVVTERGLRVLTNAHCVENHVFVEVRRYGRAKKYVAEVEAIGHECDLALLRVDEPSFFAGTHPIPIGPLPELSDLVSVCGYPIGGERVSVTQGIVSRIELVEYAQSQRQLLAVQVDAAINSGNSGGPVLKDGMLVGIAFQGLDDAQQIGYMIASPVIEHFLADVASGSYAGFPCLGVVTQALESEAHRRSLGLARDSDQGVLMTRVVYGGSAWGTLRDGDVLLEVDGVPIACDGTVPLRDGELVDFSYLVSRRFVGDAMRVKVVREGVELACELRLKPRQHLVAEDRYEVRPSYFIYGGLLFVPLTRDYLKTWDDPWYQHAPRDLVALYERGYRTPDRTEPVVLQKVLADKANQGYHDFESSLIRSVDGQRVHSLAHLVEMVEASSREFVRIETEDGRHLVLLRALAEQRGPSILRRFGVPMDRSPDLARRATSRDDTALAASEAG